MNTETTSADPAPDPAAVFACALSLWQSCQERTRDEALNLSECFNGIDELMRQVMAIGSKLEEWACHHVKFNGLNDVWPYLLKDKFGNACLAQLPPDALPHFDEEDCLRVALDLGLPVPVDDKLPVPVVLTASNPVAKSGFREFRIQTVRNSLEHDEVVPYAAGDDPFDADFGERYFGLYGVTADGTLAHIADRNRYSEILELARNLAPEIGFPEKPVFS